MPCSVKCVNKKNYIRQNECMNELMKQWTDSETLRNKQTTSF